MPCAAPWRESQCWVGGLSAVLVWLCVASPAFAQFYNVGGICIDAQGMLRDTRLLSQDERLKLIKQEAVGKPGSEALASPSPLRKVSLKRVQQAVQKLHRAGQTLPADLEYLAGLTAIQYILFDPKSRDVILLGPAEGWTQLPTGEVVGETTRRPVLHLEDLIAALRYAFAKNKPAPFIGCSIDPTAQGVQRYANYMNHLGQMDRSRAKQIFAGMEDAMGPQAVRLFGVDPASRFALTMVAADYRLKRISLGHDVSPVKGVTNYLDLTAKKFKTGPQKQHRWWFEAEYDAIRETPDHLAFELVGQGVKVVTAPTIPGQNQAQPNGAASPQAEEFAKSFTQHFSEIAEKQPIFAELQNLIALSALAELIAEKQSQPNRGRHWFPGHFLDAKACPVPEYFVPKQVPSIANYRLIQNRHWLISVSGGVEISPKNLIDPKKRDAKPARKLEQLHEQIQQPEAGQFWRDEDPEK